MLDPAVDPEQIRLRPTDPQYERLAVRDDLEVVVRDATAELLDRVDTAGPDAGDDVVDHARIRSPLGSHRGSAATSPPTRSPKISTSTGCPTTARSAGRYAYAI